MEIIESCGLERELRREAVRKLRARPGGATDAQVIAAFEELTTTVPLKASSEEGDGWRDWIDGGYAAQRFILQMKSIPLVVMEFRLRAVIQEGRRMNCKILRRALILSRISPMIIKMAGMARH